MPKLNPDHIRKFTQEEAAASARLQEAKKKAPLPSQNRVKPIPVQAPKENAANVSSVKSMANKFTQPNQFKSNAVSPPAPQKKQSFPSAKVHNEPPKKANPVKKEPPQVTSPPKPKTPPAVARINASNSSAVK